MSASRAASSDCDLCRGNGGTVLWRDAELRVVQVADAEYPGFVRVIWNAHVREMTDLAPAQRTRLLAVVCAVEEVLRSTLVPDKINLASLGNMVPHLHWHVIARFGADPHYPNPVWGVRLRAADPAEGARQRAALAGLAPALARALAQ